MATVANSNDPSSERSSSSRRSSSRGAGVRALKDVAAATVSTETILDLVQRLGLVDILVNRLRNRLETAEMDDLIDEVGDYLRRNPEVLVVGLAAITVSAGLIVYLNNNRHERDDFDYDDDEDDASSARGPRSRRSPAGPSSAPARTPPSSARRRSYGASSNR